jgi:hypothetical protein
MQTETSVRDVSDADILAGRKQVFHPHGYKRTKQYLVSKRTDIQVRIIASTGVKIDAEAAQTHRIWEVFSSDVIACFSRSLSSCLDPYHLLGNCEDSLNAPGFANIGLLGQPSFGAHQIFARPQSAPSRATIRARGLALQAVRQGQAQLPCRFQVFANLLGWRFQRIARQV